MITYLKDSAYVNGKNIIQIACNSGDTKPTSGVATGSICYEANTGKKFMFDEESGDWVEFGSGGGGGGGGGDLSTAEVTLNMTAPEGVTIVWSDVIIGTGFYDDGIYYFTNSSREVSGNKTSIVLGDEGGIIDGIGFPVGDSSYYVEISEATLSGDITFDSEQNTLIVTGDCTITADLLEE